MRPRRASDSAECCVGDSLTMIPPVTGNGMSMAFESAELALEPLARFSRTEIPWSAARQTIARSCDRAFAGRLRWASLAQKALLAPGLHPLWMTLASRWTYLWRFWFGRTR